MSIRGQDIATFLGAALVGEDREVSGLAPLNSAGVGAVAFSTKPLTEHEVSERGRCALLILPLNQADTKLESPFVRVERPRASFALVMQRFFPRRRQAGVAATARISSGASLGARCSVGEYVTIGDGVSIGDDAVILDHVTIHGPTTIGKRVYIKSSTVIGQEGFGVDFLADGTPVRMPQIGGVVIGDDVELGALNTVCAGTLAPTLVEDLVKCDDHVHIAHNAHVGTRSILTAGAVLSGGVKLGAGAWLGPNSAVINKAVVGDASLVGIGAVVTKSMPSGIVAAGNPARVLRDRRVGE